MKSRKRGGECRIGLVVVIPALIMYLLILRFVRHSSIELQRLELRRLAVV